MRIAHDGMLVPQKAPETKRMRRKADCKGFLFLVLVDLMFAGSTRTCAYKIENEINQTISQKYMSMGFNKGKSLNQYYRK